MKKIAIAVHASNDFNSTSLKTIQGYDFIHVDVMDGKFVNNSNLNLDVFRILKNEYNSPLIAHLMVVDPSSYIKKIVNYIDYFLFHIEVMENIVSIIKQIKKFNKKIGLVLNPETKVIDILKYLKDIHLVLAMGVNPGWSGQKFILNTINKVNELSKLKDKFTFEIDVDGGIDLENAKALHNADILTSSSTILKARDPNNIIQILKNI